jgi:Tfp pilus assembly PilM family ATPase
MLENKETLAFADQRLTELIKDGISLEQELLIESLQKQLLLSQQQVSSVGSQKDQLVREVSRYQEEFTAIKQE